MKLGVNVDHVATIREARKGDEPDPVAAAAVAEMAGADGITCHLREDRRHIQDRDLQILRKTVHSKLNLEMAPTQEMLKIALYIKPDQATLVPEKREEVTTEGGLDVQLYKDALEKYVRLLKEGEITVSLFIDPDLDQVKAAHMIGADAIELHTGAYSEARSEGDRRRELTRIRNAVLLAQKLGIHIYAGHGLNYHNVRDIVAIEGVEELNIGHSIVSRAVLTGMEKAVSDMIKLIR